jgi:hypothetical protein
MIEDRAWGGICRLWYDSTAWLDVELLCTGLLVVWLMTSWMLNMCQLPGCVGLGTLFETDPSIGKCR